MAGSVTFYGNVARRVWIALPFQNCGIIRIIRSHFTHEQLPRELIDWERVYVKNGEGTL